MDTPLKALLAAILMASIFDLAVGTNYTIGKPGGTWDLQTDLEMWASSIKFQPGDFLVFSYIATAHDVLEVTGTNFGTCTKSSPISSDTSGNAVFKLTAPGSRYFICSIGNHCISGMKVQIDVETPSPPSPPSPPPSSSPSPSPSPSPSSSPLSPKSSPPPSSPPPSLSSAEANYLAMQAKVAVGILMLMLVAF